MESLEARLNELAEELSFVGDWTERYRLLVEWGEEIEQLPQPERTSECEIVGCNSPLWLRIKRTDGKLDVSGSSPGILPKALLAVMVRLFHGLETAEGSAATVVDRLDLRRNLSPTRLVVFERMVERVLNF